MLTDVSQFAPFIRIRDPVSRFNDSLHHILGIACLEEKFDFALSCRADVTSSLGPLDVTTSAINSFSVLDHPQWLRQRNQGRPAALLDRAAQILYALTIPMIVRA